MQGSVEGGFAGRTHKLVDGCYTFWQGALFPLLQRLQPLISQQQGLPLQMPPATGIDEAPPSLAGGQQSIPERLLPSPANSPSAEGASQHNFSSSDQPPHEGAVSSSNPVQPVGGFKLQQPDFDEAGSMARDGCTPANRVSHAASAGGGPDTAADEVWLPDIPDVEVQTPEQQARAKMRATKVFSILISPALAVMHTTTHISKAENTLPACI